MATHQLFIPITGSVDHVNWNTITLTGTEFYDARRTSSGAQNDEISRKFSCDAGTYRLSLWYRRATNAGIYTVSIDGVDVGTVDGSGTSASLRGDIAGVVLAAGSHTLRVRMATKNAGSTGFFGYLQGGIALLKTG